MASARQPFGIQHSAFGIRNRRPGPPNEIDKLDAVDEVGSTCKSEGPPGTPDFVDSVDFVDCVDLAPGSVRSIDRGKFLPRRTPAIDRRARTERAWWLGFAGYLFSGELLRPAFRVREIPEPDVVSPGVARKIRKLRAKRCRVDVRPDAARRRD